MHNPNKIKIRLTEKGKSIFAICQIERHEIIVRFERNFTNQPSNKTLRIAENTHQLSRESHSMENFINHSCEPNGYINFKDMTLRALRRINEGEEITYNYLTADWDDEDVFDCKCGSARCLKKVHGFKNLSFVEKQKLKRFLSPFLKKKLREIESAAPIESRN